MDTKHNKYDDIINLERPISSRHRKMTNAERAAQFAPFAALTGHKEAVKETARIVDSKKILDDYQKERINQQLQKAIDFHSKINITYFVKDNKKDGGYYKNIIGTIRIYDECSLSIILYDKTKIKVEDIYLIDFVE